MKYNNDPNNGHLMQLYALKYYGFLEIVYINHLNGSIYLLNISMHYSIAGVGAFQKCHLIYLTLGKIWIFMK